MLPGEYMLNLQKKENMCISLDFTWLFEMKHIIPLTEDYLSLQTIIHISILLTITCSFPALIEVGNVSSYLDEKHNNNF